MIREHEVRKYGMDMSAVDTLVPLDHYDYALARRKDDLAFVLAIEDHPIFTAVRTLSFVDHVVLQFDESIVIG